MGKITVAEIKKVNQFLAAFVVILSLALGYFVGQQYGWFKSSDSSQNSGVAVRQYIGESIILPSPLTRSNTSVESAMKSRRSKRSYSEEALNLNQVSQLLWSLQGETADWGGRTTPSAKSAYPLELTVVVKNVDEVTPGIYHYSPNTHTINKTVDEVPENFDEAAVQSAGQTAPLVIYVSANYDRMTEAFDGSEHDDNVLLEAGHAGQNLYLQVESLGLGTVVMGGFNPQLMQNVLQIPSNEELIYQIPVGIPSET